MSTDWYTKLVLTVVAVCAAIVAAQDLRDTRSGTDAQGRYSVQAFPMARMMVKTGMKLENWPPAGLDRP